MWGCKGVPSLAQFTGQWPENQLNTSLYSLTIRWTSNKFIIAIPQGNFMCPGGDNRHAIKRRKLFIPANFYHQMLRHLFAACKQKGGQGSPWARWRYQEGKQKSCCKFTEFSSTENTETQLSDLSSNYQLFGNMQVEISWDKVLRPCITNRV